MNPMAIPWIAAGIGIGWMVFMGLRAKKQYLRQKKEEDAKTKATEAILQRLIEEQRLETEQKLIDERQTRLFATR